jgi:hypothetical protein
VDTLEEHLTTLATQCTTMQDRLGAVQVQAGRLMTESIQLQDDACVFSAAMARLSRSDDAVTKRELVEAFLRRFSLSDDEAKVLTQPLQKPASTGADRRRQSHQADGMPSEAFFAALAHLHQIASDVKILLMADQRRAG